MSSITSLIRSECFHGENLPIPSGQFLMSTSAGLNIVRLAGRIFYFRVSYVIGAEEQVS